MPIRCYTRNCNLHFHQISLIKDKLLILLKSRFSHFTDFGDIFGIFDLEEIAKFILDTASKKQVYGYFPGDNKDSIVFVYEFGNKNPDYVHIMLASDGFIISAYPVTDLRGKPFSNDVIEAGTAVVLQ